MAPENPHDELLMMIAGRAGGIGPLLDSIFSFLYRKTDFYHVMLEGENMGFAPGVAEKLVLAHFRKYEQLAAAARAKQAGLAAGGAPASQAKPSAAAPAPAAPEPTAKAAVASGAARAPPAPASGAQARAVDARDVAAGTHLASAVALESTYNGGQTDKYVWEQTISDLTMTVPLPAGTRSRDIACTIGRTHLKLQLKGEPAPLLDADYPCDDRNGQVVWEQVKPDECVWNVNDSKCTIYLEKERESWWKSALHGDLQIDTTKVDSVKRVDEYDGETQGAIRKIMFDQEQKRKGLPTSDELKHADILKQAWDTDGSPFKGTPFNPGVLAPPGSTLPIDARIPGGAPDEAEGGPAGPVERSQPPRGSGARMQELPDDL